MRLALKPRRCATPSRQGRLSVSLILGKGWLEFGLGTDIKQAQGSWGSDRSEVDWENTNWMYTTQRLDLRYGVTRRSEVFWTVKTHYLQFTNSELGTDITQFGIGDPGLVTSLSCFEGCRH